MCKEKKEWGTLPYALLILLQSVLYGFGNPLSKIGFESITVLWCLGIRFSGAAALMLLLFGRRTVRTLRAAPLKAWLPCSLAMAAAYASCNMALQFTTPTNVGFLMSLPVLFTPALARLVLKRPYYRLTRANTPDSVSFRRFLPFSPWLAPASLRLKKQKSLENTSPAGARQFCRSRNVSRQEKVRREYLPYCQGT